MNSTFVTTTIPYVNARPHLGFALELVQADCLARFHRKIGGPVHLQTGTDENAFKNVEAARLNNTTPQEWVNQYAGHFRDLALQLNIQFDDFVRTTESRHRETVHEVLARLNPADLERRSYQGLYCKGCEDFWLERDAPKLQCPEHGTPLTPIEEENIFFLLSRYQKQIETLIETNAIQIRPPERRNEILAFVKRGLQDISISRSTIRSDGWGIPFPGATDQVVYVWIDALINYLVPQNRDENWWSEKTRKIHVLGKNVWKFHAIYWPALLLSCGEPLPDELIIHGFVTIDGRKISKSSGPTVDPADLIRRFGADPLRFYLLHEIPAFSDGDFSLVRLEKVYEDYFADGLGNLTSRLLTLAERAGLAALTPLTHPLPDQITEAFRAVRFGAYLDHLWTGIDDLNREIEQERPWEWLKADEIARTRERCSEWLQCLYHLAFWLEPALPETSVRLIRQLTAQPLAKTVPLFPRLIN